MIDFRPGLTGDFMRRGIRPGYAAVEPPSDPDSTH